MKFHLPTITCTMLRPPQRLKPNQLIFEFPRHVNKVDIRNYLQSLYGVKILKVNTVVPPRTRTQHPKQHLFHKHPSITTYVWEPMKKKAYVTIDGTFRFPEEHKNVISERGKRTLKKKRKIEKRIKLIKVFRDEWDQVVEERYMGMEKLPEDECQSLTEPMSNLQLDDLAIVKGSAKTRVHLNEKGKPRKEGKL